MTEYNSILVSKMAYFIVSKTSLDNNYDKVLEEILLLEDLFEDKNFFEILGYLINIKKNNVKKTLETLKSKIRLSLIMEQIIEFLISQNLFNLIPEILRETKNIALKKLETKECQIYSSHELNSETKTSIIEKISQVINNKCIFTFAIKKDLILGLQVIVDNYVWEVSFAKQIRNLEYKIGMFNEE